MHISFEAPSWLPYRFRSAWNRVRLAKALARLDDSAPMPAPGDDPSAPEIHMLVCRHDVELAVLALKSLFRFQPHWPVAITDDGSVTKGQRRWVDHHLPACRWLPRVVKDPRLTRLRDHPRLLALYEGGYAPIRKLVHPIVLAARRNVVVLDPDTAFWSSPERLFDWAFDQGAAPLFLHDDQDELHEVPVVVREGFEELRLRFERPGGSWSMPFYFFNSGLLAYDTDRCKLDVAEGYLEWLASADPRYRTGKAALWFGDWTPEQTAYQLMFAAMSPPSKPLGSDYRIGGKQGRVFNHFLGLQLMKPSSLQMLSRLVETLP